MMKLLFLLIIFGSCKLSAMYELATNVPVDIKSRATFLPNNSFKESEVVIVERSNKEWHFGMIRKQLPIFDNCELVVFGFIKDRNNDTKLVGKPVLKEKIGKLAETIILDSIPPYKNSLE